MAVVSLSPLLDSGFVGDDSPNSVGVAKSALEVQGKGFGEIVHRFVDSIPRWASSGRFFPLSAYGGPLFFFVDENPLALKLFVLALVLLDLCLLAYLTTQVTGSRALGILAILITPLLLQFRVAVYHDPIVAYSGLLQVVVTYVLISLVLFLIYLRSAKRRYLIASLVVYAASLLTYEITIPLFLLHMTVAWLYPKRYSLREAARRSWPYAALAGATVLLAVGLRLTYRVALSGRAADYLQGVAAGADRAAGAYVPSYSPVLILRTLAHQVSAALPLGFQELGVSVRGLFPSFSADMAARPAFNLLLVTGYVAVTVVVGWQLRRDISARSRAFRPGLLVGLGVGFLVLPNVLIALSPRYQTETAWGIGYLPVYASCFGMALLLLALTCGLYRLAARAKRSVVVSAVVTVLLAAGLGYVAVVNHENNRISVETANVNVWYARDMVTTAMERGLLNGLPSGSTLVMSGVMPWDVPEFFSAHGDIGVASVTALTDFAKDLSQGAPTSVAGDGTATYRVSPGQNSFYLEYGAAWENNGYAVIGKIYKVRVAADGTISVQLEPASVYAVAAPLATTTPRLLSGRHPPGLRAATPSEVGVDPAKMTLVASGPNWRIFSTISGATISEAPQLNR
jgi:hypothetical protein